jgi:phosphoribosylformylglycinamidine synthase
MPNFEDLDTLDANHQLVTRYVDPKSEVGAGITDEELPFPICPNGSARNIAGICDPTGLIFGLMPHPEAAYATFLHPQHTRNEIVEEIEGECMKIFRNAVEYCQSNL